ncbi:MAG TPA: hypothetical protein VLG13_03570 [Patescibacteria group bacterium]|nr:hypothetical protein [Patescibacteria group bacterium]
MPPSENGLEQPRLYADSDDKMVQRRVEILDFEIRSRPELYMVAAATVGRLSLTRLVNEVPVAGLVESQKELRVPKERLRLLLQNRDSKILMFDIGSDSAIYDDPSVKNTLEDLKSKTSQRVQTGSMSSVVRPNPEADQVREHLDMLKLFIYATRVREWKKLHRDTRVPHQAGSNRNEDESTAVPNMG